MNWRRVETAAEWDAATLQLPPAHVLQRWDWGDFKSRWGWRAERWLLGQDDRPQAAVQLLRRPLGPLSMVYAPRGPLARDESAYPVALAFIEQRARALRAVTAMVDGDGWAGPGTVAPARPILVRRGWRLSAHPPQFRNTALTRIDRSDEALLADFKPKWRYNLRLAERRGVVVRPATPEDWPVLLDLYAETGRRDGFVTRPSPYYTDAWRTMGGEGLIAEADGAALAGLVLFRHGPRAWYFYGMSRTEGRDRMPNHALQWDAQVGARGWMRVLRLVGGAREPRRRGRPHGGRMALQTGLWRGVRRGSGSVGICTEPGAASGAADGHASRDDPPPRHTGPPFPRVELNPALRVRERCPASRHGRRWRDACRTASCRERRRSRLWPGPS